MIVMGMDSWKQGEPMQRRELPTPEPRAGEVRVAVHAAGVNPVDWKMRKSGPLRLAARVTSALRGPAPPVVVGVDFSGQVEAVGPGVSEWRPGDRVVGGCNFSRGQRGSYADTVVVRPDQLCKIPDSMTYEIAGCLPVAGVTAHMALTDYVAVGPGTKVLVLGASGGVGQFAVQIAKRVLGADFVGGVCSSRNAQLVRHLGADEVFDHQQGDALVQASRHGRYSVIVDCTGSYGGRACRRALARPGVHVMVAVEGPLAGLQVLIPPFRSKAILGSPDGARLKPVVEAVEQGKVVVRVAHRFPLAEAESAHELSRGGRVVGKIVLLAR